ncbi:MAG: sigma-54 dependent transcriptional regulator [Ignavibacteriae bacterium]|nr:sigma-54 dependent transcriptional regulator [Ignavibacteriota bacterium]
MKTRNTVLVVDDEAISRLNIKDALGAEGIDVDEAEDGLAGLKLLKQKTYHAALLDIRMPNMDGLTALKQYRKIAPDLPVIVFTAYGTSEKAIEAMKEGAFDYLTKPFDLDELSTVIRRAFEHRQLSTRVEALQQFIAERESSEFQPDQLVSKSPAMQKIFKMIGQVAPSNATVLIEGETGTGKELVANALWYHSERRGEPFVKINCAAIPESLLESELFGHERGAFTGAEARRIGRFELAHKGTLFLDEVSEMSTQLQSKLLRVLEQSEFQRVGGAETIRVDVRILAATNRTLQDEVKAGRFRKDLYFRLQVVHLSLPPLRERKEDIALLVKHFLKKYGPVGASHKGTGGKRNLTADPKLLTRLADYPWPGNVRELENVIQRATVLASGKVITQDHLSLPRAGDTGGLPLGERSSLNLHKALQTVERDLIQRALEKAKWNRSKAAKLLGINRRQLFEKIKELKLKE